VTERGASELVLFVAPYACPRVTAIALEEAEAPYETVVVSLKGGDQRRPDFLRLNPKGKVPCLLIDGEPLSENVAILLWLADTYPDAGLLPAPRNRIDRLRQIADLSFCASGLHPIVSRIRMTQNFVSDPVEMPGVKARAIEAMQPNAEQIDARLERGWWYGDNWSVMDAYLFWIWFRITGAGFPAAGFPNWAAHYDRMLQRPSTRRMLAREETWQAELERRGLAVPPHPATL
jgi:glutathione S-transferase